MELAPTPYAEIYFSVPQTKMGHGPMKNISGTLLSLLNSVQAPLLELGGEKVRVKGGECSSETLKASYLFSPGIPELHTRNSVAAFKDDSEACTESGSHHGSRCSFNLHRGRHPAMLSHGPHRTAIPSRTHTPAKLAQ